jgi:hypothetical protein
MKAIRSIFFASIFFLTCSCFYYIHHDEDMAAIAAIQFARVAIIEKDFEKARNLLPPETSKQFDAEKLKEMIESMHPVQFPHSITATDFEPMPGTNSINIFLRGDNANGDIYYRFTLRGTSNIGYKVYALHSRITPYPSSNLRLALPIKRSTNDLK